MLNKSDLADDVDGRLVAVDAIAPGVATVVAVSAWTGDGLDALRGHLRPGTTAAILGSSGVGKSTLVNALLGEDRQATGEVRDSDSRGRHTTTHRELFELPGGALLVDTPGIRSLEVLGADEGVDAAFDDVVDIAATCRFSDCRHEGEPGCAIRAALADGRLTEERLASHRKLEREIARAAREAIRGHGPSTAAPGRSSTSRSTSTCTASTEPSDDSAHRDHRARSRSRAASRLPDPATAPAIPGLRVRAFRDGPTTRRLAELIGAANLADGIPYLPTAGNARGRDGATDGSDRLDDIVLVEVDGRLVAAAGVERVVRDDAPMYKVWGKVDPDLPAPRARAWLIRLEHRACPRARRHARIRACASSWPRSPRIRRPVTRALLAGTGFEPVRHFFLMRNARSRRRPGRAAARGARDPAGRSRPIASGSSRPRTRRSATTGAIAR